MNSYSEENISLNNNFKERTLDETLEVCRELLPLLSKERMSNYDSWFQVGCCLWNITDGADEGLELWDEVSKKGEGYTDTGCELKWRQMKSNKYTLGSLYHWVKTDDAYNYNLVKPRSKEFVDPSTGTFDMNHNYYFNDFLIGLGDCMGETDKRSYIATNFNKVIGLIDIADGVAIIKQSKDNLFV